jgi:hypothetical protein
MPKVTRVSREVEEVLHQNRISPMSGVSPRDSDKELIIQVLQIHREANFSSEQLNVIRSLNFESISRARRKFQENGLYLPSPEVAKARRLKSYEIQQVAPVETAAGLQNRIERNIE